MKQYIVSGLSIALCMMFMALNPLIEEQEGKNQYLLFQIYSQLHTCDPRGGNSMQFVQTSGIEPEGQLVSRGK